jgi:hypothetical protein
MAETAWHKRRRATRLRAAWAAFVLLVGQAVLAAHVTGHAVGPDVDTVCEICALAETAADTAAHTSAPIAGVAPRAVALPRELASQLPLRATGARDPPHPSLT